MRMAHVFLIRKHEFSRPENSRTWHSLLSIMSTLEPNSKILLSQEPKPPCTSVLRHTPFILGLVCFRTHFLKQKSNPPRLRRNSSLGFSFILVCQALNKSTFFLPLNWSSYDADQVDDSPGYVVGWKINTRTVNHERMSFRFSREKNKKTKQNKTNLAKAW